MSALDRLYLAEAIPTLIVWGDGDTIIPVSHAYSAHEVIAGSRLEIIAGSGHFPHVEAPERFLGVMGMPINASGEIEAENLTLACRNAVLNMMELLQERGFSREQAYVVCSVAVDLRISNVVDVPNYVVSALLPEAIFGGD